VRIFWQAGQPGTEDAFNFIWVEAGGPTLVTPARKGFGSLIIERVLPQDFSGQAALIHDPSGNRCELSTQMRYLGESQGPEA
jgi:two-component sensor histidine kinase